MAKVPVVKLLKMYILTEFKPLSLILCVSAPRTFLTSGLSDFLKNYLCAIMSKSTDELFKNVISHAKEYGFVFQSSEIYDGLSAVYDYGQFGSELKNNIKTYWWKAMVQMHENIVGIDSAIFMHPTIWKASGHVDGFSDPMIDNKDSKKRYRTMGGTNRKMRPSCVGRAGGK